MVVTAAFKAVFSCLNVRHATVVACAACFIRAQKNRREAVLLFRWQRTRSKRRVA